MIHMVIWGQGIGHLMFCVLSPPPLPPIIGSSASFAYIRGCETKQLSSRFSKNMLV